MRNIINILLAAISWFVVMGVLINMDTLLYAIGTCEYILALFLVFLGSCVITGNAFSFEEEES